MGIGRRNSSSDILSIKHGFVVGINSAFSNSISGNDFIHIGFIWSIVIVADITARDRQVRALDSMRFYLAQVLSDRAYLVALVEVDDCRRWRNNQGEQIYQELKHQNI